MHIYRVIETGALVVTAAGTYGDPPQAGRYGAVVTFESLEAGPTGWAPGTEEEAAAQEQAEVDAGRWVRLM